MHLEFCKLCHGIGKLKCLFCKQAISDYRNACDICGEKQKDHTPEHKYTNARHAAQVQHNLYLRRLWERLKKFNMLTCGLFTLDEQIIGMWGAWRQIKAAESYARDIMRGVPFPTYLTGTELGAQINKCVADLSGVNLLIEDV